MSGRVVVFDLGNVVLRWEPLPAIAAVVGEERAAAFLADESFAWPQWNHAQDAGRAWRTAEDEAVAAYPQFAEEIRAYATNYALTLPGTVPGTVEVLRELVAAGVRLVALTNWSAQTFPVALAKFPEVFSLFSERVVSGEVGVAKPDPAIFAVLAERLGRPLTGVLFVDDSPANVAAGAAAGLDALLFTDAARLREALVARGLLGTA